MFAKLDVPLYLVAVRNPNSLTELAKVNLVTEVAKVLNVKITPSDHHARPGKGKPLLERDNALWLQNISTLLVPAEAQLVEKIRASSEIGNLLRFVPDREIPLAPFRTLPLQQVPGFDETEFGWHLQVTKVHKSTFDGTGVKIGILDTGLQKNHRDFQNRPNLDLEPFYVDPNTKTLLPEDEDDVGHGTAVAGLAGGPLKPAFGPRYGVAPGCSLFCGRVSKGSVALAAICNGLARAVAVKCDIISMSLSYSLEQSEAQLLQTTLEAIGDKILVVAAAGNEGTEPVQFPAALQKVKAIGFVAPSLKPHPQSPSGIVGHPSAIDFMAPGDLVTCPSVFFPAGDKKELSSIATPQVAGIAALWWQKLRKDGASVTPNLVWQEMIKHAQKETPGFSEVRCGAGLVQAP